MTDLHVESLLYRFAVSEGLSFANPPALERETEHFILRLENDELTVLMKEHYDSVGSAQAIVQPFLRNWELRFALDCDGRRLVRFVYLDAKVIDRHLEPGKTLHTVWVDAMVPIEIVAAYAITHTEYPAPPQDFIASPEVEVLWHRYERYVQGKEPLASMAYFCLTVVEWSAGGGPKRAEKKFGIDKGVLEALGNLTAKGDEKTVRKFPKPRPGEALRLRPHTPQEERWLKAVVRMLIRRAGEEAAGVSPLRKLTMADFPSLP